MIHDLMRNSEAFRGRNEFGMGCRLMVGALVTWANYTQGQLLL